MSRPTCSRCDAKLEREDLACPSCGWAELRTTELVFLDEEFPCPECGESRVDGSAACLHCGTASVLDEEFVNHTAFGLDSIFTITTLSAVAVGSGTVHPALGIGFAVFATVACIRAQTLIKCRAAAGYSTSVVHRLHFLFSSFFIALAACFLTGLAAVTIGMAIAVPFICTQDALTGQMLASLIACMCIVQIIRKCEDTQRSALLVGMAVVPPCIVLLSQLPVQFWPAVPCLLCPIQLFLAWRNKRLARNLLLGAMLGVQLLGMAATLVAPTSRHEAVIGVTAFSTVLGFSLFCLQLFLERVWVKAEAFGY